LPSATHSALGKEFFKKNKKLCPEPPVSHPSGARQRNLKKIKKLCRVPSRAALGKEIKKNKNKKLCRVPARAALGKEFKKMKNFAECRPGWHSAKPPPPFPAP